MSRLHFTHIENPVLEHAVSVCWKYDADVSEENAPLALCNRVTAFKKEKKK